MLEEGAEGPGLWDSILSSSPTGGLLPPSHSPEVPTDDPQAPLCPEWVRWNWQKPAAVGRGSTSRSGNSLVSGALPNLSSRQAIPVPQSAGSPGHTRRAISTHPRHASQSGQYKNLFIAHFLKVVVHLGGPWGRMCKAGDTSISPVLEPGAGAGLRGPCPGAGAGEWVVESGP